MGDIKHHKNLLFTVHVAQKPLNLLSGPLSGLTKLCLMLALFWMWYSWVSSLLCLSLIYTLYHIQEVDFSLPLPKKLLFFPLLLLDFMKNEGILVYVLGIACVGSLCVWERETCWVWYCISFILHPGITALWCGGFVDPYSLLEKPSLLCQSHPSFRECRYKIIWCISSICFLPQKDKEGRECSSSSLIRMRMRNCNNFPVIYYLLQNKSV